MGEIASELLSRALDGEEPELGKLAWTSAPMGQLVDIEDKEALWAALDTPAP
ncbi:hypothetical protein BH24ACT4_BH24ACT4_19350 [soil metagenome]